MKNLIFVVISLIAISCVEINKLDHQTPATAKAVTINRQMQRVIRYDCQGRISSDQLEEVQGPSLQFYMASNSTVDLLEFKALNETTNSLKGIIAYDQGTFILDLAKETTEMKAVEGINQIYWAFTFCTEKDQSGKCTKKEIKEAGTAYLNISLGEEILEGKIKIKCHK